jgi:adenylate cyclase
MTARRMRHLRPLLFIGVGLFFTGFALVAYGTNLFRSLELDTVDARFAIRGTQKPPKDLVVVKIDDVTFNDLRTQWPFPRKFHARVVDAIAADHPKAIVYDVQFTEPTNQDLALADSIYNAGGKVVLATTETNARGQTQILGGDSTLQQIGAYPANANLPVDPGGVLRRVDYSVDQLQTVGVVAAEVADGHYIQPRLFDGRSAWIDYYGPPGTIPSVSFSRVYDHRLPRGFFRDKVVVIGPSAPSLQDVHATSTTGNDEMSGAEIQANSIETVRRGLPLKEVRAWVDWVLIVVLGLLAPLLSLRARAMLAILLALGVGAVFVVAVQLAFNSGRILAFVYPLGALVLTSTGALGVHYLTTAIERERVRDLFSRFVPEDVVDDVLARADEGLRLGGVQREGTVMFCDLRGFTSFAESMPPDRVIGVLNVYLSEMSDAILDHGGTLVAYMGDGIMAVFGAPLEQPDHADRALAAAREMVGTRLPRFNGWLASQDLGQGFRMGIGLNSGWVMSGNVGSERRMEYTAIGDTTNTASRIEALTKGTAHQLFLTESTRELLRDPPDDLVYVDEVDVRGRQARVKLWSLPEAGAGPGPGPGPGAPAPDAAPSEVA